MSKTIVALYDDFSTAERVVQELVDAGFTRENISLVANDVAGEYGHRYTRTEDLSTDYDDDDVSAGEGAGIGALEGGVLGLLAGLGALAIPGIGPVLAAGPLLGALIGATAGAVTGGLVAGLMDSGVPETDAQYYAEGVRRGGTLVSVHAADDQIDEAVAIMNRYSPINVEERADAWRESGYTGYDASDTAYTSDQLASERRSYQTDTLSTTDTLDTDITDRTSVSGEAVVPVVQEELQVGKRAVETGGVRVHTTIEEVPVQEQVELRQEHVTVERRPTNRAATEADINKAVQQGTLSVTETQEQAVVNKEARVVEEVVIGKDVDTRTETISDTVRRTDVDVERMGGTTAGRTTATDFNAYDTAFRNHYQTTYGTSGQSYDRYQPAYRYGYDLATNPQYSGRDWMEIEPEARRSWESRNQGTWESMKDAAQRAWDEVRGRR
jgi:uncharacterized protein (TIGR02271 family)